MLHQECRGVRADTGKSHMAEGNQAGVAEQQVEPDRRHGVAQSQGENVQPVQLSRCHHRQEVENGE